MTYMRPESHPTLEHLLGSRTRGRLIAILFRERGRRLWVREMCRGTGSASSVTRELRALRDRRMAVMKREAGVAYWSVIEEHPLVSPLRELIRVADELDAAGGYTTSGWRVPDRCPAMWIDAGVDHEPDPPGSSRD
jgi:DNA-binding transcriptional ArsR family regulator